MAQSVEDIIKKKEEARRTLFGIKPGSAPATNAEKTAFLRDNPAALQKAMRDILAKRAKKPVLKKETQ